MKQQLDALLAEAKASISSADNLAALEGIRVRLLGKKGQLTDLLKAVSKLSAAEKPELGKAINLAKRDIHQWIQQQQASLEAKKLEQTLAAQTIDITLPGRSHEKGSLHPVTHVTQRMIDIFSTMGFQVAYGPEIEDDYHNFEALNFPPHHPARTAHDTFYFGNGKLLRTHTSPVQIRMMKQQKPPLRIITPGRVYRSDSDQTHTPMFHQMEGLVVDRHCTFAQLKGCLQEFLNQFFETELEFRFRPSYFPFTEPSAEVDIRHSLSGEQAWMEILGCGM
nr:phenylalanine--tRNA ligase subunit alpha [Gammaproteobacteria bacterium]MCH9744316.1 phenylalanine--tRNA ligase subunit alpha [Gammaproteobacteria bacterium]